MMVNLRIENKEADASLKRLRNLLADVERELFTLRCSLVDVIGEDVPKNEEAAQQR